VLVNRIDNLEQELAIYKKGKNSGNSHTPPSSDLHKPKRNQSLRAPADKKRGGQQGHEGSSLSCSAFPDQVVTHIPHCCSLCGDDLSAVPAVCVARRQVIDIPLPAVICTGHQAFSKTCCCGMVNKGDFPINVNASVQYGSRIEALTAYLNVRQYMPYGRIQEFYSQVMGLSISQGGIVGLMDRFTEKALPVYQQIKNRVEIAACLGTVETGAKVNGKTNWFWTWQNQALTFIVTSAGRGYKTIAETFPEGLPNAVLVHDRWAAHFQCKSKHRQICLAHLFRDLDYIQQVHGGKWAGSFKRLLKKAIALGDQAAYDGLLANPVRDGIQAELAALLKHQLPLKHKLTITLQKKLRKISENILCFLHYNDVPSDNNGSERAIRNIKVKQKISGGFRSAQGADGFAVLRSTQQLNLVNKYSIPSL
jgi:transposase